MGHYQKVCPGVFQIGGGIYTDGDDCCIYLAEGSETAVLIDTGVGNSVGAIIDNIQATGIDINKIGYIIVTHGHIDHIGGLKELKELLQAKIIAHQLELEAIEEGNPRLTAAAWYGQDYKPVKVDRVLRKHLEYLSLGNMELSLIHTPGHTPGGISILGEIDEKKILFGQDIHGPFHPDWGSDKKQWRKSMLELLDYNADILCEGHAGIIQPAKSVRKFIQGYLNQY
ncbi:MBL fold metallo-hydrolase [Syntrophomonas erecta]